MVPSTTTGVLASAPKADCPPTLKLQARPSFPTLLDEMVLLLALRVLARSKLGCGQSAGEFGCAATAGAFGTGVTSAATSAKAKIQCFTFTLQSSVSPEVASQQLDCPWTLRRFAWTQPVHKTVRGP